jgi:hypothetical protein
MNMKNYNWFKNGTCSYLQTKFNLSMDFHAIITGNEIQPVSPINVSEF